MTAEKDKLKYEIDADSSKYIRAFDRADKTTLKFDRNVGSLSSSLGKAGLAGVAGIAAIAIGELAAATWDGVKSSAEWERKLLRTQSLIKATGNAAGFQVTELSEFAKQLDLATLADRDDITKSINILQTFRAVHGDVFKRAIKDVLDLSEVYETDLKSQTIQMGKALTDYKLGLTALRRVGVDFTEQQKKQIEAFFESGHAMEGQIEILKVIEGQVGGAAVGAAGGLIGKMDTLNFKWREYKENLANATGATKLANKAIEILIGTLDSMNKKIAPDTQTLIEQEIAGLESRLKIFEKIGGHGGKAFDKIKSRIQTLQNSLEELRNPTGDLSIDYGNLNDVIESSEKSFLDAEEAVRKLDSAINTFFNDLDQYEKHLGPMIDKNIDLALSLYQPVEKYGAGMLDYLDQQEKRFLRLTDTIEEYEQRFPLDDITQRFALEGIQYEPDAAFNEMQEKAEETSRIMIQLSQRTAEAMEQNFSDFFFDVAMNKFETMADYLNALTQSIVRAGSDISGQMMKEFIFGAQTTTAITQHAGGPAGVGPKKTVPAASFIGAPQLHYGLRPDEFRAILQKGETVLPKGESGKIDIFINPMNESGVPLDVQPRIIQKNPDKIVAEMIIKRKFESRYFRQSLGGI